MDTLVLNASYAPLAFVDWKRAMVLICENKVTVLEEYPDRRVHSVRNSYSVPSVVLFKKFVKKKRRVVKFSRDNIWLRDRGICQYCGQFVDRQKYTYDHVNPKYRGGKTEWENIVCCCYSCNQKKAGRTPKEANMALQRYPFKPSELPTDLIQTIGWRPGMPASWMGWLMQNIPTNKELTA